MKICFASTLFALSLLCTAFPDRLLAGNGSEIIYKTDREFQTAEFSQIASGKNFAGGQHAISRREFKYRVLREDAESASESLTGKIGLAITPFAGWYHSPYDSEAEITPVQLIYLYNAIPDAVSFTAGFGINDFFYAKLIYTASCSKKSVADGSGFLHPISGEFYDSGDSPKEGYVSFAGKHLSACIGRLKGGTGHGLMGNLFQNSRAPYYDQISFSFYNRFMKYSYMIGWSSYYLTENEKRYLNGYDYNGNKTPAAVNYDYQPLKLFAFHRLEFAFTDTLSLGVGEMTLTGGKFPDLNMINPLGVYHNIYESTYHSYYSGADISWVPAKNHFLFFEALANEIYIKGESNTDPTALGIQLGYWFILPVKSQTKHRIAVEITHVDGWTYSDLTPYLTMYQRQIQREIIFDIPLGYSYGGDCQQASLSYTAVSLAGIKLNVSASYLQKGEIELELKNGGTENALMPYSERNKYKGLPTGTVEHWFMGECALELPVTKRITINFLAHYSYICNFGHVKGKTGHLAFVSAGASILVF